MVSFPLQVSKLYKNAIEKKEIGLTVVSLISILWLVFRKITSGFIDRGLESQFCFRYLP